MRLPLISFFFFIFAALPAHASTKFRGVSTPVDLARGSFPVWIYTPGPSGGKTSGLIVFGSGDGGWTEWEDRVCASLAQKGFYVGGVDSKAYAKQPYGSPNLRSDYQRIAAQLAARAAAQCLPLLYGGYSTGAEQSVAAAVPRPDNLKGLLLIAPGKRGRFGMTLSDLMGMTPTGPDTFALSDCAEHLDGLRIAQFHGEHDPLDSTEWLKKLRTPHKLYVTPGGWHTFHGADDAFLAQVAESTGWLLNSGASSTGQP